MVDIIVVNSNKTSYMDMEDLLTLINRYMKDILKIIKKMVLESLFLIKIQNILDILLMVLWVDKGNFINKNQVDLGCGNKEN